MSMPPRSRAGQVPAPRGEPALSPRLYEAMAMLAMPMDELETRLQEELAANPLLEIEDPGEDYDEEEEEDDLEDDEGLDWEDAYFDDYDSPAEPDVAGPMERRPPSVAVMRGLHDCLEDQLGLLRLDDKQMAIAQEIVGNIDDDGFLGCSASVVAEGADMLFEPEREAAAARAETAESGLDPATEADRLAVALAEQACDEVEEALAVVQSLDPAGVGARDLPECLLLQLRRLGEGATLACRIVQQCFDAFAGLQWTEIAARLEAPVEEVEEAARRIAKLDPKPGRQHDAETERYVVPDLIVEAASGEYRVFANDAGLPRLRLARSYVEAAEQGRLTGETKQFVAKRMEAASWFLQAVEQRRRTIVDLMKFIVDHQRTFFDRGVRHLAPLTMREAADAIGVAESTVSRAANGKYVQSPAGVHPLRYFFSGGFVTISGEAVSVRAVEARIAKLVEDEDPRRPLTDDAIMTLLKSEGIKIARRTVGKYRDALGISNARTREGPQGGIRS